MHAPAVLIHNVTSAQEHTNLDEETKSAHKTVVFSEGQRIENDFNTNRSVIQVEDFVVRARLNNTRPIWFSWRWTSTLLNR